MAKTSTRSATVGKGAKRSSEPAAGARSQQTTQQKAPGARSKQTPPPKTAAARRASPSKTAGRAAPAHKGVAKPAAKKQPITREQSLATIRALVEAKKQRARQGPSWPGADPHHHRARESIEASHDAVSRDEQDQSDAEQRSQRDRHETRGVR